MGGSGGFGGGSLRGKAVCEATGDLEEEDLRVIGIAGGMTGLANCYCV